MFLCFIFDGVMFYKHHAQYDYCLKVFVLTDAQTQFFDRL